jgi:hypothetical protein
MIVGMHLPDTKLPLLRHLDIKYLKRAEGAVRAEAWLEAADVSRMKHDEKGDVLVPVTVADSAGTVTVECAITWAWRTR